MLSWAKSIAYAAYILHQYDKIRIDVYHAEISKANEWSLAVDFYRVYSESLPDWIGIQRVWHNC